MSLSHSNRCASRVSSASPVIFLPPHPTAAARLSSGELLTAGLTTADLSRAQKPACPPPRAHRRPD